MACGRAVVVSAAGGAAELFTEGEDALGHTPGNVDVLAKVLRRLMRDPALRERLGENARRTAEQRHSEKHFASELLGIYSQCLTVSSNL
jgi:glycosyltransferase involved in cell wall biosynthesis